MAGRDDFREGTVVINVRTNRRGTVVRDPWGVCGPDEIPVQYDGEDRYLGTDWRELEPFDFGDLN